jgi:hypothetical protein
MQHPPAQDNEMLLTAINAKIEPIVRQLERMEERMESRTRDLVTRGDLESLRKELVTRDAFEPQLHALKMQLAREQEDRESVKKALEKRLDEIEAEQLSRQDRLWMRVGQVIAVLAFIMVMFEFLTRVKLAP